MQKITNDLFLKACKREKTERTPVWMMRQAGRYLPQYQAIRSKYGFLTMCKTPEIAAEISIQPVDIIGVDAAIIFSDILVIPEAMGMELIIEEGKGPRFTNSIKNVSDIDKLRVPDPAEKLRFLMDAISMTKKNLGNRVPLIGFSGSPWTLFSYMVEGDGEKDFINARVFMYSNTTVAKKLFEKLTVSVLNSLTSQIESGADAIQIFDTWGGLLGYDEYKAFSLQYIKFIIGGIKSKFGSSIPVIVFSKGAGSNIIDIMETGCDVVGLDWTFDIGRAKNIINNKASIQGNLDPVLLLSTPEAIVKGVKTILKKIDKSDGHIFNLGHGILPQTLPENAKLFVDTVKNESRIFHQ